MNAQTDVLIIGAGPVGLMAAYCLSKHGVKVRVVEKLSEPTPFSKAFGVQPHNVDLFAQLSCPSMYSKRSCDTSLIARLLDRSVPLEKQCFYEGGELVATLSLNLALGSSKPLIISQREIEMMLELQLTEEFGVKVDRCWEFKEIENLYQDPLVKNLVCHLEKVSPSGEPTDDKMKIEANWLIAADGGHSTVRHMLHIPFKGVTTAIQFEMADVFLHSTTSNGDPTFMPQLGSFYFHNRPAGSVVAIPWLTDYGASNVTEAPTPANSITYRFALQDQIPVSADGGRQLICRSDADFLRELELRLSPLKLSFGSIIWKSQFGVNERKIDQYRHRGRIFFAGDAAHVHSPAGGFGMNTGLQDAHNLAWKLAFVVKHGEKKVNVEQLLDSYSTEREPIAVEVLAASGRLLRGFTLPRFLRKLLMRTSFAALNLFSALRARSSTQRARFVVTYRKSPIVQAQPATTAIGSLVAWLNPLSWLCWLFTSKPPRALQGQYFRNCRVIATDGGAEEEKELFYHIGYSCNLNLVAFCGRSSVAEIAKQIDEAALERYSYILQLLVICASSNTQPADSTASRLLKVFGDPDGKVHRELGLSDSHGYFYVVRPDGYIGFQGALAELDQLKTYLRAFTSSHPTGAPGHVHVCTD